ncbi:hypothetical protein [Photobacterium sp. R1]
MRRLIPFFGLVVPAIYSPIAAASYFQVSTCDEFVDIYNNYSSTITMEIENDLDCSNSPTLKHAIRGSIIGNSHKISHLNFAAENEMLTKNLDLRDVTFINTSIHNIDESYIFSVKSRWSNVNFLGIHTTGLPFKVLFYELRNNELSDSEFDLSGVKLDSSYSLAIGFLGGSHLTNVKFSNATVNRRVASSFSLLAETSFDSYVTNVKFSNIKLLGQPTGPNGWTNLGFNRQENTHVNGYTLEDISFFRTSKDSIFCSESDNKSTYVNITHNLFDDNQEAGAIPLVRYSQENLESRVINFQSMNQPTQPPAMCAPYLLQDSYFAIQKPEL